ncbi:hypothetical protein HELRODRAFT_159136 [Helobdella robusta]|uniref:G-protein coupled receptors family 1 profile domain-containing protein n=1 Tax=Helobdella robusta TaxID=6412 RepID=T1ENM9_HELRO|nr:hypothetical protein HELRODRAFT_159136 [Helobdella robusta]ESO12576.1 hypothetical protein HELRODRAFT_159136 [Helobdella robusta]
MVHVLIYKHKTMSLAMMSLSTKKSKMYAHSCSKTALVKNPAFVEDDQIELNASGLLYENFFTLNNSADLLQTNNYKIIATESEEIRTVVGISTNPTRTIQLGYHGVYLFIYTVICYYPIMYIGPLFILTYLNVKLIVVLKYLKKKKSIALKHVSGSEATGSSRDASSGGRSQRAARKTDHITKCVVAIVSTFIFTQTPALLNQIFWATKNPSDPGSLYYYYSKLSDLLVAVNSASNFFIYCLLNDTFRNILLDYMRRYCCCLTSLMPSPNTNNSHHRQNQVNTTVAVSLRAKNINNEYIKPEKDDNNNTNMNKKYNIYFNSNINSRDYSITNRDNNVIHCESADINHDSILINHDIVRDNLEKNMNANIFFAKRDECDGKNFDQFEDDFKENGRLIPLKSLQVDVGLTEKN